MSYYPIVGWFFHTAFFQSYKELIEDLLWMLYRIVYLLQSTCKFSPFAYARVFLALVFLYCEYTLDESSAMALSRRIEFMNLQIIQFLNRCSRMWFTIVNEFNRGTNGFFVVWNICLVMWVHVLLWSRFGPEVQGKGFLLTYFLWLFQL